MKKTVHTTAHLVLRESLIKARKKAGLTQQALADRLGKPQSFVAKYEGGERRLDVVEFTRVTAELGVKAATLIRQLEEALD